MTSKPVGSVKRSLTRPGTPADLPASLVALALGILIATTDVALADKLIGLFAVLTIVLRLQSKLSFALALICLADVPLLAAIGKDSLSEQFAVYAFYFLCIGTLNALFEGKPDAFYSIRNSRRKPYQKPEPFTNDETTDK